MIRRALAALAVVGAIGAFGGCTLSQSSCGDAHDATSTVATVHADGSMDVVEDLTFDFDGSCHGGFRDIDPIRVGADDTLGASQYSVGPITVTENGESVPIAEESTGHVKWGRADVEVSGHHVYQLEYHIEDAVFVAPDVGVLYWQFLGNRSPHQNSVDVTVHMPGSGADLEAFGHGVLNGVITPQGADATVHVEDNPANNAVEVRIVEGSSNFTVPPTGEVLGPWILAAEAAAAKTANERRKEIAADLQRDSDRKNAASVASPIVALLGAIAFAAIFFKWGKEPPPPPDIGEYYREIPDDPPAVCQAVRRFGSVSDDAFSATLIDLAQRGWLTISEEHSETTFLHRDKTEYRFTRTSKSDGDLTDYESKVLWRLFPNGGTITQSEFVDQAKADRTKSAKWMESFKKSIHRDVKQRGYIDEGHLTKWLWHFLTIAALIGVGVLAFVLGSPWGFAPIGVAVVLIVLSPLLRKRTEKGAHKLAEVNGLAKFLEDFSRLPDEAHAGDLVLYERYLVYAVALGVADQLIAGLRVRFPQLEQTNSGFATWYVAGNLAGGVSNIGHLDSISNIGSFASEFSSATAAAFSPPSSSSGGGGGFSGGGGGGGGGGGSGGW